MQKKHFAASDQNQLADGNPNVIGKDGNVEDLELFGIALTPVIAGLVQALKALGMPSRLAPWAVTIFSMVAVATIGYVDANPEAGSMVEFFLNLLIYILGSVGFYEGVRWAAKTKLGFVGKPEIADE